MYKEKAYSIKEFQIGLDKNKLVKWKFYQNLYEVDKKLLDRKRVCPKLTHVHVNPDRSSKMRVYVMAQVINF